MFNLKNKLRKRSRFEIGYSLGLNLLNAIFPLLTLPFVFKCLAPNEYGDFVLVNIIYQLVTNVFISLFSQYFIREYVKLVNSDAIERANIIGQFVYLQSLVALVSIPVFLIIFMFFYFFASANIFISLWFYIPLVLSALNVEWYYFATRNYKVLFYRTLVVRSALLISVCFTLKNGGVEIYSSLMTISYASVYLIGFVCLDHKINYHIVCNRKVREAVSSIRYFLFSNLLGACYQYLDQLILSIILGKSDLAALNVLKQVLSMSMTFPSTLCRFMMPSSIMAHSNGQLLENVKSKVKLFVLLICSMVVVYYVFGYQFLMYFTHHKYSYFWGDVLVSGLCMFSISTAVFIDTQLNIPSGNEKFTTMSNLVVLIGVVLTLFPFVHILGYTGAMVALFFGESLGVLAMIYNNIKKH